MDLLAQWQGPGTNAPESYRGIKNVDDPEFWHLQNRAVGLLIEIERVIDEMQVLDPEDQDLAVYRDELVPVYKAVYGFAPLWQKSVGGNANTKRVLPDTRSLRLVASLIRRHRQNAAVAGGDRDGLRAALDQALAELGNADYLRAEVRAYLVTLVQRALMLVGDASATDGQIRSAAHEAAGAIVAVEATSDVPAEKKSRLRNLASQVATAVVVNIGTEGAQNALTEGAKAVKALLGEGDSN